MITDAIGNLGKYLPKNCHDKIMKWVRSVDENTPEGEYEIDGDAIFARVLSYHTKQATDCRIEAHNRYVDIQSTLRVEEGIQVYRREFLETEEGYSEEKDVEFFLRTEEPFARLKVKEGMFALLFPYEAHQPEISYSGACPQIKKFVIKVKEELFNE